MSIESAKAFVERMNTDDDFRKELDEKSSGEDRMQFVKANGFDFSKEEFEQVKSELSEGELESLSGGHRDGNTHTGFGS
ncbi:MAG: Nif11-like leader peptide family natural product precursor [Gammaproteobacteria bacterium]|nr:Nif11-like leader peptide family natural product precursor [Gammaproteobacteria bacterium]